MGSDAWVMIAVIQLAWCEMAVLEIDPDIRTEGESLRPDGQYSTT